MLATGTDGWTEIVSGEAATEATGVKLLIAKDISLTTSASYEVRTSNLVGKGYHNFGAGPKLDFKF